MLLPLIKALALGAVGGWLFDMAGLPLAWMMGAMTAVTVGSFAGLSLAMQPKLRTGMIAVLGVALGANFSPAMLQNLSQWLVPIGLMLIFVFTAALVGMGVFQRLLGWDRATAYFSAMPGGLAEMVLGGEQMGGHGPTISLMHSVRIMMAVFTIPLYFRFVEGVTKADLPAPPAGTVELAQYGWLSLCWALGLAFALKGRPRIPAGALIVPMFLAAAFSLSGYVSAKPPSLLVQVAQVVLGTGIGCRFQGVRFGMVAKVIGIGAVWTLCLMAMVAGLVWSLGRFAEMDFYALFLALSPGGLAEMSLIALALHLEAAFVSGMHVLRVAVVVTSAPLLFRMMRH